MLFKKDEVYMVETKKRRFFGRFAGQNSIAEPLLAFEDVIFVDEGRYAAFLKSGKMDSVKAYRFKEGFYTNLNALENVFHIVQPPKETNG